MDAADPALEFDRAGPPAARALPLHDDDFSQLMAPLEPFEARPRLAVAVSGGADSMALTLLAARWASARGGEVLALTVDHGLRAESADEAIQVGHWLAARGVAHRVLAWTGPKPATGIQAAARMARYGLLLDQCRTEGILHLLLGHHRDDQAETVALRLAGRSGDDGLAAMAPIVTTPHARLLRPLLPVSKARLVATLRACGQPWIEDPSNRNVAFARTGIRSRLAQADAAALSADELAENAARSAASKSETAARVAVLLSDAATVSPAGYAVLDADRLMAAPEPLAYRALAQVLRTIGGLAYPPRGERLERLWREIRGGLAGRRTLAGCLVSQGRRGLLFQREPAAMEGEVEVRAQTTVHWDGRYQLRLGGQGTARLGPLGAVAWRQIKGEIGPRPWPGSVCATLPALFDAVGVAVVPHFGWRRAGFTGLTVVDWVFAPPIPLTGGLVWHRAGTMC